MKFPDDTSYTFRVMVRTQIQYKNKQWAITQKVQNSEKRFFYTAFLLNEIYPPMKFHDDTLHTFSYAPDKIMTDGRSIGRTDGQSAPPILDWGA